MELEEAAMLVMPLSSQRVLWQNSEQHNPSAQYLIKTTLQTTLFHVAASRTRYQYKSYISIFFLKVFCYAHMQNIKLCTGMLLTPRGTRSRNDLYTQVCPNFGCILFIGIPANVSLCLQNRRGIQNFSDHPYLLCLLWLCFRAAAPSHHYHQQLRCLTSLRSACNLSNLCINICLKLARAIHYRQNNSMRVLSPLTEPGKMDFEITLAMAERLQMLSITCKSSWITRCETRTPCGLEMLCWWANTNTWTGEGR